VVAGAGLRPILPAVPRRQRAQRICIPCSVRYLVWSVTKVRSRRVRGNVGRQPAQQQGPVRPVPGVAGMEGE